MTKLQQAITLRKERAPRSDPPEFAAVLNVRESARYVGMRDTTFWQARRAPDFPAPIQLTARLKGFKRSDLDRWLDARRVAGRAA